MINEFVSVDLISFQVRVQVRGIEKTSPYCVVLVRNCRSKSVLPFSPTWCEQLISLESLMSTIHYNKKTTSPVTRPSQKSYSNNTFIDWNVETLNIPKSSSFSGKKWLTIILTSLFSGYIVTLIDLISVWLNDTRKGLCLSKLNHWSLLNPYLTCPAEDWHDWSQVMFDSNRFISSVLVNFPLYVVLGSMFAVSAAIVANNHSCIRHSGIPEVKIIVEGFNYNVCNYLGLHTLLYKCLGLTLVVSSGFWLGKEGALVHVTCCVINIVFGLIFGKNGNEAVRRELLSAATATGISLAFNSPIGGVLFVLESLPSYFIPTKVMWNSFIGSTIAVVVLVGFKMFTEGDDFNEQDLFKVEFGSVSWLIMEIIPFIALGVLGAFYGCYFISLNAKFLSMQMRRKVQLKLCSLFKVGSENGGYLEILVLFLLTSLLNYPVTITRLPLNACLKILFTDCKETETTNTNTNTDTNTNTNTNTNSTNFMCNSSTPITTLKLLYIAVQGFFFSCYTFGTMLPGGVLMPSLVIGATCGRFVGILSQLIQTYLVGSLDICTQNSCLVSPSSYAVIGAGAFMTGVTKLTMCVVVILFELTGAVLYVLPIMLAVMVLKFVSDYLCEVNIYDSWLKYNFNVINDENGVYNAGKGNGICNYSNATSTVKSKLPEARVADVMVPITTAKALQLVPPGPPWTVASLYDFLNDNHEGYPFVASIDNPVNLGYVHKQDLYQQLGQLDVASHTEISFDIDVAPSDVLSQLARYQQQYQMVPIHVDPEYQYIIMNEKTSLVLLIEVFEKLHLNYLLVKNANQQQLTIGFVDRFMVGRLIDNGFEGVREGGDVGVRRERMSIELIT